MTKKMTSLALLTNLVVLVLLSKLVFSNQYFKVDEIDSFIDLYKKNSDQLHIKLVVIEKALMEIKQEKVNTELLANQQKAEPNICKSSMRDDSKIDKNNNDLAWPSSDISNSLDYIATLDEKIASSENYAQELQVQDEFQMLIEQQAMKGLSIMSTQCGEKLCEIRVMEDNPGALAEIDVVTMDGIFENEILIVPDGGNGIQRLFVGLDKQALLN